MRIFVDRDDELMCVDRLVRDSAYSKRIALACAVNEMGKTTLLEEIYDRYRTDTAVVFIDIGQAYEIPALVDDIADQLMMQGLQLPAYGLATPVVTVQISNVQATNSPIETTIENISSSRQEGDRLLRQLLIDIEAAPGPLRRLILIDRYEKAEAPLRDWLRTSLIPRLLSRDATICVLAGRSEPKLTYAEKERADRLSLRELNEVDIDRWLDAEGVAHTRELVKFLRKGTRGVPGTIHTFILNLKTR